MDYNYLAFAKGLSLYLDVGDIDFLEEYWIYSNDKE